MSVEYHLENLIDELEYYKVKEIFTGDEIKQIVIAHRKFEYLMLRRPMRLVDGLRYVDYLMKLEKRRSDNNGTLKCKQYEFSIVRRIHFTYNRLVVKFHGNVQLWLRYIQFCKNTKSHKILSKVFTKCLMLHPRNGGIWIEAANWEWKTMGNVQNARILLQRGIRLQTKDKNLYHQLFTLELLFIQQLQQRREVLGLNEKRQELTMEDEVVASIEIPEMEVEKNSNKILDGAIPVIVFQNAVGAIPNDFEFCKKFVEITDHFEPLVSEKVRKEILQLLPTLLPHNERAIVYCILRQDSKSIHAIMQDFQTMLDSTSLNHESVRSLFVEYVQDCIVTNPSIAMDLIPQLFTFLATCFTNNQLTSNLAVVYLDLSMRTKSIDSTLALGMQLIETFRNAVPLICMVYDFSIKSGNIDAISILLDALCHVPSKSQYPLYQRLIAYYLSTNESDEEDTDDEDDMSVLPIFEKALKIDTTADQLFSLRSQYLHYLYTTQGITSVRTAYTKMFQLSMLPTLCTEKLLVLCLQFEQTESSEKHIVSLFEKLTDRFRENPIHWQKYISYYRSIQNYTKANAILHRQRLLCA